LFPATRTDEAREIVRYRIRHRLKSLKWHHWLIAAALVLALGFTGWHAYRAVRAAIFWSHHQKEPIQGWMTVRFVAHSYHVPPDVLYQAIGLPPEPDRRPLRVIARDQHRPLAAVTASLENAIAHAGGPAAVTKP
jgi:hypothetical protein